jgi:hypothetical protein
MGRMVSLMLLLTACSGLPAIRLPNDNHCVVNGVTVSRDLPSGHWKAGMGCIKTCPYPGMPRP